MITKQKFFTDGRKVYAKIRVEDDAILSRAAHWPAETDDAPLVGDDGSIRYLPVFEDEDDKEIDSDLFTLSISENVEASRFHIQRSIIRRDKSELKERVDNYESMHRSALVPPEQLSALSIIGLAIVLKKSKNLSLTPAESTYIDEIAAMSSKLVANNARGAEIKAQIEAGQDPDIKTGWTTKSP